MQKQVDKVFFSQLEALRESADLSAISIIAGKGLTAPVFCDGKQPDGLDESGMSTAFDRAALNAEYMRVVQQPDAGSHRDVQALKTQMDVLSGMERDLRMRYRTRSRMSAHGIARLKSHGLADGPIARGALQLVKLLMDAQ